MEEGPRQEIKITEPGTIYDNLLPGDHIQSFQTNRPNVNYSTFEQAVLSALAWTHGIPPEILMLKFGSNYSASRQANNEFEVYLSRQVKKNADDFCQQIYEQFVTQAVLTGQLNLPGFIGAYNDVSKWRMISAWLSCAWIGLNRPAVDRQKEVSASQTALDNGLSTFDIEARRTCGLSFAQVMQTQKRERELMERMGFTPHVDEDNNGKPAYSSGNKDDGGEDGDDGNNGAI
jgi:capsid protein